MSMHPKPRQRDRIDFGWVAEVADLPSMLASEGITLRRGKAMCPFHDNQQTEALSVYRQGNRWQFKCHSCDAKGDAIDWRAMRDGISKLDAARLLDGGLSGSPIASRPAEPRRPDPPHEATNPEWQAVVTEMIEFGVRELWSAKDRSRQALDWLHCRGLSDNTIRLFKLGFYSGEGWSPRYRSLDGQSTAIHYPRGISFPWASPDGHYGSVDPGGDDGLRWIGCNVRKLMPVPFEPLPDGEEKNECFARSRRGFGYPFGEILPSQCTRSALICEGELDALLAWQEVGDMANVLTVGSAKQRPDRSVLVALARCPWVLLALDGDEAGLDGMRMWRDLMGEKGRPLLLYGHKDVGDMHAGGVSIRDWFVGELSRLGIDPNARVITWQERVANWPMYAWRAWNDRSIAITPEGATADQIKQAQHRAYELLALEAGATP